MTSSSPTIGSANHHSIAGKRAGMQQLASLLAALPQKALAGATSLVKTMQTARMMSTLARMSDKQLEQIGISRSDIPRYAVGLIEAA